MAGALVFVFLLDAVPDFNINLKESFRNTSLNTTLTFGQCDVIETNPILSLIGNELNLKFMPKWNEHNHSNYFIIDNFFKDTHDTFKDISSENLHKISTLLENSLLDSENEDEYSFEKLQTFIEHNEISEENHSDCDLRSSEKLIKPEFVKKVDFPESAPFLVAIFETLSNVTAQTCAGTIVAPNWVLTAASCVNLLGNMAGNLTNSTEGSHYTIIANSHNPLIDGTVHNVTKLHLHPESKILFHKNSSSLMQVFGSTFKPSSKLVKDSLNTFHLVPDKKQNSNRFYNDNLKYSIHFSPKKLKHPHKDLKNSNFRLDLLQSKNVLMDQTKKDNRSITNIKQLENNLDINNKTSKLLPKIKDLHKGDSYSKVEPVKGKFSTKVEPSLALMRIEPEVQIDFLSLGNEIESESSEVKMYGWTLVKNGTNEEVMKVESVSGEKQDSDCKIQNNPAVLCIKTNSKLISQLSSGGPVLSIDNNEINLLGVLQVDEHNSVMYPVTKHAKWILKTVI